MAIDVVSRLIFGEAYILEGLPPTEQLLGTESQHDVHIDQSNRSTSGIFHNENKKLSQHERKRDNDSMLLYLAQSKKTTKMRNISQHIHHHH
jgi:hypothetical protein